MPFCRSCKKTWKLLKNDIYDRFCPACKESKCNTCRKPLPDNRPRWETYCKQCYYENNEKRKDMSKCSINCDSDSE